MTHEAPLKNRAILPSKEAKPTLECECCGVP